MNITRGGTRMPTGPTDPQRHTPRRRTLRRHTAHSLQLAYTGPSLTVPQRSFTFPVLHRPLATGIHFLGTIWTIVPVMMMRHWTLSSGKMEVAH